MMTKWDTSTIKSQILDLIRERDDFLLLGHHSADGDSLGSMIALGHFLKFQLGKKVYMPYPKKFPLRYSFLEKDRQPFSEFNNNKKYTSIVLDCSSSNRLDAANTINGKKVDIVIDHHEGIPDFDGLVWKRPDYPAVGLMIYELLYDLKAEFTPEISRALYTAILTDTGQFAFAGTNADSLRIAGFLVENGAQPAQIARDLYWEFPFEYISNMKVALNSLELHFDDKVSFIFLKNDEMTYPGQISQTEAIIDLGIMIRGVQITALFREIEPNLTRISFRSREGIDVSTLAKKFNGGGRYNASGCNIEKDIDKSREIIISELSKIFD